MKWHSYSGKKAVFVGISAAIGVLLMSYLSEAMRFGGGSIPKGWLQASSMMGLYGIMLAPFYLGIGVVFALICKPIGIRIVFGTGVGIFLVIIAYSAYTSRPEVVLRKIGELGETPQISFTHYDVYPSFSDGTTIGWSASCDETSATSLFQSLKLQTLPKDYKPKVDFGFDEQDLVSVHEGIFGKESEQEVYLTSSKGFVGTYSPSKRRLNLLWSPILNPR